MGRILWFAVPLAIGRLMQALYGAADMKIVGLLLGQHALAAVGSVSTLCHLLNGFLDGSALGCSVIITIFAGQNNKSGMKSSYTLTVASCLFLSALLAAGLTVLKPVVLEVLQVPEIEAEMAGKYLIVMLPGLVITGMNCVYTNVLRSLGDTWTPILILGLSTALNVGLDFLFIAGFHTGVIGAGLATIAAQLVSSLLCWLKLRRLKPWLRISAGLPLLSDMESARENRIILVRIIKSGLSLGLQSCIVNIGTVAMQIAINEMGSAIIVAHASARRVFELAYIPFASLGFAMVTCTAANLGAGDNEQIRQGYRLAIVMVIVSGALVGIAAEAMPSQMIAFMASSDNPTIIYWGSIYLRIELPALVLCGVVTVSRGTLQGMGRGLVPVLSSLLELVIKLACAWISIHALHYWGIIISEPVSWFGMSVMLLIAFRRAFSRL